MAAVAGLLPLLLATRLSSATELVGISWGTDIEPSKLGGRLDHKRFLHLFLYLTSKQGRRIPTVKENPNQERSEGMPR